MEILGSDDFSKANARKLALYILSDDELKLSSSKQFGSLYNVVNKINLNKSHSQYAANASTWIGKFEKQFKRQLDLRYVKGYLGKASKLMDRDDYQSLANDIMLRIDAENNNSERKI